VNHKLHKNFIIEGGSQSRPLLFNGLNYIFRKGKMQCKNILLFYYISISLCGQIS